jgi:hypothetical protein
LKISERQFYKETLLINNKKELAMNKQQLLVQLQRVKCVDETGGKWAEKAGNDEISLSGFGIDAAGQTVMIPLSMSIQTSTTVT